MPTPTEIEVAIAKLTTDSGLLHSIVHGGVSSSVVTEGGTVPSVAKAISDLTAAIVVGFAAGFVAKAADNAARATTVPAQAGQLLIQMDTKALYYSTSTTMGAWTIHPVQSAQAAAEAATAAVEALTTTVGLKMATATYVGGAAAGVVRTAERIDELMTLLTNFAEVAPHYYGAENTSLVKRPTQVPYRVVDLVDGEVNHSDVSNTSRNHQAFGTGFAIIGAPKRLVSWGQQTKAGILGSGVTGLLSNNPRFVFAAQQPDRNLPGFDPASLYTAAGQIVQVKSGGAITMARTASGLILVAGTTGQGVKALMGSGVDKTQSVFMPIYFNLSGTNKTIRLFDFVDPLADITNGTGIFVDDSENVWLLTNNPTASGYGNSLTGAQNVPVCLNPGYGSWSGKIVRKVRCDATGGIYILFTNGELWAGGGNNSTGLLGTGATTNILNPLQISTGVDDFDVSGDTAATLALWILQSGTLKGAGYNANGQMGQGNTTNKSSFVTIGTNVDFVRMGGTDNVTLIYRDTSGVWKGLGRNIDGSFGQGTTPALSAINHTPVTLSALAVLIAAHGTLVDLCIAGYAGKHATCALMSDGTAWTVGNNTDGCLANGLLTATNVWSQVLWQPLDKWEKLADVSAGLGVNQGPAFHFRTSYGRLLLSGATTNGFATGMAPALASTLTTASPINWGQL